MRYISFIHEGQAVLGIREGKRIHILGNELLDSLLARGVDLAEYGRNQPYAATLDEAQIKDFLPPLVRPPKIFCVGLNYADHTKESDYEQPDYPTIFPRYHSSLVAHQEPIVRPLASDSLDFEGEMAVVLTGGGRHIAKEDALRWVAGYSVFNDGSIREYQFKSPQWTIGKNFDNTGAFGPDLVTADELPPGGRGLTLETRLNGVVVQCASTDDMLFDVATLISILSEAISLEAGDVIVTGTPSGIGWARDPRLLMREGDICEVSISQIGTLRNSIENER
ncbi:fumarylacetoacetate hydrolase family protein [Pollutimonas sp. H1-120]|uniref:fumarylacetoacetate hydrolase family protein n=1 Tax=Pollutimonas sp. H1-120 TaxID=3148824 RepID=UPI003B52EE7B